MSAQRPETRLVLSAFPDGNAAEATVRSLLGEQLIACGTMIPGARSLYLWKGSVEESSETVVLFKTSAEKTVRFLERLRELHPYEVPEIVLLEPDQVPPAYEAWVRESLSKPE